MTLIDRLPAKVRDRIPLAYRPVPPRSELKPTWRQARVGRITRSLAEAQGRDPGGWYVCGTSTELGREKSFTRVIAGRELVLFRDQDGQLRAGPGACPHMGALLDGCEVRGGEVFCRWHGLAVGEEGKHGWRGLPANDDGLLLWVRLPTPGEEPSELPRIIERTPLAESVSAVMLRRAICEPDDVIANRLDPWHGAWFHPYSFSHLTVDEDASTVDRLVVEVTFRLTRSWGVPVRAEFTTPDRRTIVMKIVEGEGVGSVVETHVTPIGRGSDGRMRTVITEATIAHSGRPGFAVAKALSPLLRPAMIATAGRLWVDDLIYAERRYELRRQGTAAESVDLGS